MNKDEIKAHMKAILPFLLPHQRTLTVFFCPNCQAPIMPESVTYDHDNVVVTCLDCKQAGVETITMYYK